MENERQMTDAELAESRELDGIIREETDRLARKLEEGYSKIVFGKFDEVCRESREAIPDDKVAQGLRVKRRMAEELKKM